MTLQPNMVRQMTLDHELHEQIKNVALLVEHLIVGVPNAESKVNVLSTQEGTCGWFAAIYAPANEHFQTAVACAAELTNTISGCSSVTVSMAVSDGNGSLTISSPEMEALNSILAEIAFAEGECFGENNADIDDFSLDAWFPDYHYWLIAD